MRPIKNFVYFNILEVKYRELSTRSLFCHKASILFDGHVNIDFYEWEYAYILLLGTLTLCFINGRTGTSFLKKAPVLLINVISQMECIAKLDGIQIRHHRRDNEMKMMLVLSSLFPTTQLPPVPHPPSQTPTTLQYYHYHPICSSMCSGEPARSLSLLTTHVT